jgi:hypothetical protein
MKESNAMATLQDVVDAAVRARGIRDYLNKQNAQVETLEAAWEILATRGGPELEFGVARHIGSITRRIRMERITTRSLLAEAEAELIELIDLVESTGVRWEGWRPG